MFKTPKLPGGAKYRWTNHVQRKMWFYGLTPSRVLRVVNAPQRVEEGVAEGTLAGMQTAGTKQKPWEIWAMWRLERKALETRPKSKAPSSSSPVSLQLEKLGKLDELSSRKVIITAWRYPGVSPVRGSVPIPADVLAELEADGIL